jgi:hypothetical protein
MLPRTERGLGMILILWRLAAFGVVMLGATGDSWAWGDEGHKVICEIAMRLVQPTTRAEIQKLISKDDRFDSFSDFLHVAGPPAAKSKRALSKPAEGCGWAPLRELPQCIGLRRDDDQEGFRSLIVHQREPGAKS